MKEKELQILRALQLLGFNYITRDEDNSLTAWEEKIYKFPMTNSKNQDGHWFFSRSQEIELLNYYDVKDECLFEIVTWADDEPTSISELIQRIINN